MTLPPLPPRPGSWLGQPESLPTPSFIQPPVPIATEPVLDPVAEALAEGLRDAIWTAAATSPRSLQVTAGASEIGGPCARQTAYRTLQIPAVNFPDPGRSVSGIGEHLAMADCFRRLDGGSGRYLVEHPVEFMGVPGTVDLVDRRRKLVVDWKFPLRKGIADVKRNGPSQRYVVQLHIYAAALLDAGEPVERVALAFKPADGGLSELYVWQTRPDPELAISAINAAAQNAQQAAAGGPGSVPATPSRLCPWCSHYRPSSTHLDVACPGDALANGSPR